MIIGGLYISVLSVMVVISDVQTKYVEGEISSSSDWKFITRFCFLSAKGTLKFTFEYPVSYGPQNILLYYDTPDQWDAVYKSDKGCIARESVLDINKLQIINLTTLYSMSGCVIQTIDGIDKYSCRGGRTFRSSRERWWYLAVSHCYRDSTDPQGIRLDYKIHMTNGPVGDYLHREYSADEFYILPISCAFLGAYVLLCILTIICAVFLRNRQLWHTTYKMYMASVFLWTFYLFLNSLAYGVYGNDGLEWKLRATKYAARSFESISIMVFLLMLILIGKGYTITRGKLSTASTVKITVFMTLYAVTYVVIFVWEAIVFDPGLVLYLYESPPGYALIAMRIIGYIWFCYAIFFTLKHYPEKGKFYYPLFVFYTLWFLTSPVMILIATFSIPKFCREKVVFGIEAGCSFLGSFFFLVLTRPSAANKNFPYHVRTTQIGIMQNVPHQLEGSDMNNGNFANHAYAVSSPLAGSSSGPDLTSLFTTSKTHTDEKHKETSLNHNEGMTNGLSNGMTSGVGNGAPPPSYSHPPAPSPEATAPPRYEVLFRAQGTEEQPYNTADKA